MKMRSIHSLYNKFINLFSVSIEKMEDSLPLYLIELSAALTTNSLKSRENLYEKIRKDKFDINSINI